MVACSVDSKFSHLAWTQQARKQGGLGNMAIPILADITKQIASDYGVLVQEGGDAGVALRGMSFYNLMMKEPLSLILLKRFVSCT